MMEHVLYLEALGNAGKLSLNYEQLIAQGEFAGAVSRFGIGAFPIGNGSIDFGVPVTVSGLFGQGNIFGEIGGGIRVAFTEALMEEGAQIIPTGILGLRYHPTKAGGLMLRLAYTPFLLPGNQYQHHLGFAIGIGLPDRRR